MNKTKIEWVKNPDGFHGLFNAESAGGGVFKDHLHRYLMHFQQNELLAKTMRDIISERGCVDVKTADRFEAAGLVKYDSHNKVIPLCNLYRACLIKLNCSAPLLSNMKK